MCNAKRPVYIALSLVVLLLSSFSIDPPQKFEIKTIVIDAGHGGHDSGCLGSSSKEKIVALSIALQLGTLIEKNYPNIKVIFTRKKDEFVELRERAEIANRNHADLFICIHCNSNKNSSAFGVETFAMGLHVTDENLAVAKRENSVILLEKDYKHNYEGFDPNSTEAYIAFSLYQQAFLKQSLKFASNVQNQSEEFGGRFNRGVKQAGFLVLYKTTMPAVLIETGFLTNPAEEKFLLSSKGQETMANTIFRAFREYKIDMEEGDHNEKTDASSSDQKNNEPINASVGEIKNDPDKQLPTSMGTAENKSETHAAKSDSVKTAVKENQNPQKNQTAKNDPPIENMETIKPKQEPDKKATPAVVVDKPVKENVQPKSESNVKPPPQKVVSNEDDIFYTVQLGAKKDPSKSDFDKFKIENGKSISGEDGITRFTAGHFKKLSDALTAQNQYRKKGFKDAFVTAYHNGKRIQVKEADMLMKGN